MKLKPETLTKLKEEYMEITDLKLVYNSKIREINEQEHLLYGYIVDKAAATTVGMFKTNVDSAQAVYDFKLDLTLIIPIIESVVESGKNTGYISSVKNAFAGSITSQKLASNIKGEIDLESQWDDYNQALGKSDSMLHIVQSWSKSEVPEFATLFILFNSSNNVLEGEFRNSKTGSGLSRLMKISGSEG